MNRMMGLGRSLDFGDHGLEPVLEFTLDSGPQPEASQDQGSAMSHFAGAAARPPLGDPQGEPLDDSPFLPTPASPVRIGLFCRRRSRMSMSWRISASRPITGSIWFFGRPLRQGLVVKLVQSRRLGVFAAGLVPSPLGPQLRHVSASSSLLPSTSVRASRRSFFPGNLAQFRVSWPWP